MTGIVIPTVVKIVETEEADKTVYNVSGQRTNKTQRGVNIVRDTNGKTRKVSVK